MIRVIAARGEIEMVQLPGGAYAVRIGDNGHVCKSAIAADNWFEAYELFHRLVDQPLKKTRKKKGVQSVPVLV